MAKSSTSLYQIGIFYFLSHENIFNSDIAHVSLAYRAKYKNQVFYKTQTN